MGAAVGNDDPISDINVTPLVDVCLVLVIIFMVTAPLFDQPVMKVELPKATTDEGESTENISITINPEGKIAVNSKEVSDAEFKAELKTMLAKSKEKYVVIRADRLTEHGSVVKALDLSKELKAKKIVFATEHKK